jgi:S-adenosylmethionine hydrolase
MSQPLVTLTTDFGPASPYVAALKGVLWSFHPQARVVDLCHSIPPQDLRHAAFFLHAVVPYYPPGTLHVVVVDPGVGTERAILYVALGDQRLLVPDNGCWTLLSERLGPPQEVRRLTERRYWRPQVSATFHGRDIFAPVAGHLSRGLAPAQLGPQVSEWVRLDLPVPHVTEEAIDGEIVFVDTFGNLISNIPATALTRWQGQALRITVGAVEVPQLVRTYGQVAPGSLIALISSFDTLEIAVSHGSAVAHLGMTVGAPVRVQRLATPHT